MTLPILSSYTRDPRPWILPDGTRVRSWHSPAARDTAAPMGVVGTYAFRHDVRTPHPGNRVLGVIREGWDDADPFGSAMTGLGAVCDVLAGTGVWGVIPQGWGYWPALGQVPTLAEDPDTGEGYHTAAVCEVLGIDPAEPAEPSTDVIGELLHAGAVFDRIVSACRLDGRDY